MLLHKKKNPFENDEDVDLTPLIDVVFLILIFFMVTSTFIKRDIFRVELTKASAPEKQEVLHEAITITITKDGFYGVNKEKNSFYTKSDIYAKIKTLVAEAGEAKDPSKQLVAVVKGDKNAPFSSYIYLESVLTELKINKRSIVVDHEARFK